MHLLQPNQSGLSSCCRAQGIYSYPQKFSEQPYTSKMWFHLSAHLASLEDCSHNSEPFLSAYFKAESGGGKKKRCICICFFKCGSVALSEILNTLILGSVWISFNHLFGCPSPRAEQQSSHWGQHPSCQVWAPGTALAPARHPQRIVWWAVDIELHVWSYIFGPPTPPPSGMHCWHSCATYPSDVLNTNVFKCLNFLGFGC